MSAASGSPPFSHRESRIQHLNVAPLGEDASNYPRQPICGQRSMDNTDWARGFYTRVKERVTCKRCLKSLARKERLADEAAQP